jgi:hypothetical protein
VEICLPIPFVDGEEAACAETVTRKKRLINKEEWAKMKPFMLSIHAKHWTEIKKEWLKGCRLAGSSCNIQVESIDKVIVALDEILKNVIKLK